MALHVERSIEAIRVYFSRSLLVLSVNLLVGLDDDQRVLLLQEDDKVRRAVRHVHAGAHAARTLGSVVDARFVKASPWNLRVWLYIFQGLHIRLLGD